jgi:putative transcription factor
LSKSGESMDCEICGKPTADLFLVSIDGVQMSVCQRCSAHGSFIKKIAEPPAKRELRIMNDEPETEIVDGYEEIIRSAREAREWEQKELAQKANETVGVIRKVEQGRMVPNEKLAKRLESLLGVKLSQTVKKQTLDMEPRKQGKSLTLGDMVVVKKKDK